MTRTPRAVLFDLDGTLADSTPLIAEAITALLRDRGYSYTPAEIEPRIGPPLNNMLRDFLGVSQSEADSLFGEYTAHYRDYSDRTPPMPGAEPLLDALAERGVPVAIVTNKVEESAGALLEALGWTDRFGVVVGADTGPRPKPAADAALEALRRLDVAPRDAAFVGDSEIDMECGHDAGIPTVVGLARHRRTESLRAAGATHACASLDEVREVLLGHPVTAR